MGSAALAHCAMRGSRVIGIEQFEEGHALGSSSGHSRIIRLAYFEDAAYVPLVLRAYELWRDTERRAGIDLLCITGLLAAGPPESEVLRGTLRAAREHGLPVETLEPADLLRRFPQVALAAGELGVYEAQAGYVRPEAAIAAHLAIARVHGAGTSFGVRMESWESHEGGVRLRCDDRSTIDARRLILTLGPWYAREMLNAGIELRVQRNVQVWFAPQDDRYRADSFPVFLLDRSGLPAMLYGFPDAGDGVKAAFHGFGAETTPDALARDIDERRDVEPVRAALESWMPGAATRYRDAKACMYELSPDGNFIIGAHPSAPNVILCGGFSGHGYKFATVIGEIASQLALDGGTPYDIGFLSPSRFSRAQDLDRR